MKTLTTKGEALKGRDAPRANTKENLSINPFARSSKIPRDGPMEDKETKQEKSKRSSLKDKEDTARSSLKHAEKLPKFKGGDDESFSVWLGKYEMMMFTLYEQSKKTAKNWYGLKKLGRVEQEEDFSTRQLQGST
jgi:hypothetical protein